MLVIGDVVMSDDIVEAFFVCNLDKCKGACCVEGDLGAPLEDHELPVLESIYEKVKPFLRKEGIEAIEKQGTYVKDREGQYSTPTISNRECAYAVYDEKGILKCGIEQAQQAGEIDFKKPISCHLYPIRVSKHGPYEMMNYDRWSICSPACDLGEALQVPIYKFVKEALVRKYGEAWYQELVTQAEEKLKTSSDSKLNRK